MKSINLFAILLIFSVFALGCSRVSETASGEKSPMAGKESNEMAEIGFEMKGGKMLMVDEKAKTMIAMEKEAALNDGTRVTTNGNVIRKDGTTFTLKEGESIWMDGTFMKAGEMMKEPMENEGKGMLAGYKGDVLAGTTTPYLDFNKEDYNNALKENKIILLNFYASWCPTCKAEQPKIFSAFRDLSRKDIVGFRVHWRDGEDNDDAVALAKQFGVSSQHTKVILKMGKKSLKRLKLGTSRDIWMN